MEVEGEQGVEFGFGGAIEIFKAGVNGEAELAKAVVVAVGQPALFDQLPKPLDEVEIGAVGGQEEQFDVEGRRLEFDQFTTLVTGVVHDESEGRPRMAGADEFEQFADTWRVDVARRAHAADLLAVTVHCPEKTIALVLRRGLDEGARKAPHQPIKAPSTKCAASTKKTLRWPVVACAGRGWSSQVKNSS